MSTTDRTTHGELFDEATARAFLIDFGVDADRLPEPDTDEDGARTWRVSSLQTIVWRMTGRKVGISAGKTTYR